MPRRSPAHRRRRVIAAAIGLAAAMLLTIGYGAAVREPAVRFHRVAVPGWPAGAAPLRLVFLSDAHVAPPDMPPRRLARIVARVNALRADCVLLGGDYIGERPLWPNHYGWSAAIAPYAALRPRIATFAVTGNHDGAADATGATARLTAAGVRVLDDGAAHCGPLTVAGIADGQDNGVRYRRTLAAAKRLGPPAMLLSHSPDFLPSHPSRLFGLYLAGHTHCGQIALPWLGPIISASQFGRRYDCGVVRDGGRTLIVGAGLGTSTVPLRLFTRPEILVVDVGGPGRPALTPLGAGRPPPAGARSPSTAG